MIGARAFRHHDKSNPMFATPAFAQAAGAAAPGGVAALFNVIGLPLLILAIFWFLVFRPQQAKMKEQRARIDAAKKGDRVVTGGGLVGKIVKVEGDLVELELGPNVRVKAVKATLADITPLAPAKPAND
jgi:preprotein translocase subunit YajC